MTAIKMWATIIAALCVAASVALMPLSLWLSWETFTFISLLIALYSIVFALFALIAVLSGKRDS